MRLEMTRRTDLALKALGGLRGGDKAKGSVLASEIGTTINYLPQILEPLTAKGWIVGIPGPGGGYRLAGDLGQISVLDVIEAVEGPPDQTKCVLRGAPCPVLESCAMHNSWVRARGALLAELGATSVESTFAPAPRKGE